MPNAPGRFTIYYGRGHFLVHKKRRHGESSNTRVMSNLRMSMGRFSADDDVQGRIVPQGRCVGANVQGRIVPQGEMSWGKFLGGIVPQGEMCGANVLQGIVPQGEMCGANVLRGIVPQGEMSKE
jgi:hypothetical protein